MFSSLTISVSALIYNSIELSTIANTINTDTLEIFSSQVTAFSYDLSFTRVRHWRYLIVSIR